MPPKLTGPEKVAEFFSSLDHPLKPAMERLREVILSSDPAITEHIKWKAPSFCHGGDDRVTFNLYRDGSIMLIFHRGAKVKDSNASGRLIEDQKGLLTWLANDRASMRFVSVEDVEAKEYDLREIVKLWIATAQ